MPTELERRAWAFEKLAEYKEQTAGEKWRAEFQIAIDILAAALQAQQPDRQDHALLKCAHDQLATRLAACEAALAERDARLMAQQPGAQAVDPETVDPEAKAITPTDVWAYHRDRSVMGALTKDARRQHSRMAAALHELLSTRPQPPSIPEPSEEDVDAAYAAFCAAWTKTKREQVADILTTYTARLRERIGQAPGGDGDA
jgi:hypothetical protein